MSVVPAEERFSKNITVMTQAIHEAVQKLYASGYKTVDPNMIALVGTIIAAFDKHYLIQGFIENSHTQCWDNIKQRDEQFFVENSNDIFKYLPMDKVNMFKDLFLTRNAQGTSVVPQSLKDQIWDLLGAMVKISIKYIHTGRSPYSVSGETGIVEAYHATFFEEVDLPYHAGIWGVKLEYPLTC